MQKRSNTCTLTAKNINQHIHVASKEWCSSRFFPEFIDSVYSLNSITASEDFDKFTNTFCIMILHQNLISFNWYQDSTEMLNLIFYSLHLVFFFPFFLVLFCFFNVCLKCGFIICLTAKCQPNLEYAVLSTVLHLRNTCKCL